MSGPAADYHARTLAHFCRPRHAGSLDPDASDVVTAEVGRYESGAVVRLQARMRGGVARTVRFKAYGGVAVIACASLAARRLTGQCPDRANGVGALELAAALRLPPAARGAAVLAEDAVRELAGRCGNR